MVKKDVLWKGIIEDLAVEFVHYFFPKYIHLIDFKQGFKFLDKELEKLSVKSETKKRQADKLFQAHLKNGDTKLFLIHIEVQGYSDPVFAKRMFQYAYRIQDRFNLPLTALVIYTTSDKKYHFQEFRESFFGTETLYRFNTFSISDYAPGQLQASDNIFGLILEVARQEFILKKIKDSERLKLKVTLVKHLMKHGITKRKIQIILDFIKYYTSFEQNDFFSKFDNSIQSIIKPRKAMGLREAILNEFKEMGLAEGREEGLKLGIEEGIKEGIEKGIEKGIEQGIEEGIKEGIEKGQAAGRAAAYKEMERIIVRRGTEKGLSIEDIAFLADTSIENVQLIIKEIQSNTEEEE